MRNDPLIAPSILTADFGRLAEQVRAAQAGGADWLHLDVMDGRFVPNISFGPLVVAACRDACDLPLDVHLMIEEPERYLGEFAAAGAHRITIHHEATRHPHRALQMIREAGLAPGLAINPLTPLEALREALPSIDLALVMSVNPGFGGQAYIPESTARIERLREWRDELNPDCLIQVDGGINTATAPLAVRAGAEVLVAGSAVFNDRPPAENLAALRAALR